MAPKLKRAAADSSSDKGLRQLVSFCSQRQAFPLSNDASHSNSASILTDTDNALSLQRVCFVDRGQRITVFGKGAVLLADAFFRTRAVLRNDELTGGQVDDDTRHKRARDTVGEEKTAQEGQEDHSDVCVHLRPGRELASALHCVLFSRHLGVDIWKSDRAVSDDAAAATEIPASHDVSADCVVDEDGGRFLGDSARLRVAGWTLTATATPGNVMQIEELLFGDGRQDFAQQRDVLTMSVYIGAQQQQHQQQRFVGVCVFNTTQKEFSVCQFLEDDMLTTTGMLIVQSGAQECRISDSTLHKTRLHQVLTRCGVAGISLKASYFACTNPGATAQAARAAAEIARLCTADTAHVAQSLFGGGTCAIEALGAAAAIIDSLSLSKDPISIGRYSLSLLQLRHHMHLDRASLSSLNVFPDDSSEFLTTTQQGAGTGGCVGALVGIETEDHENEGDGRSEKMYVDSTVSSVGLSRASSLYGLLNHCKTPMGSRRLAQWLRLPLTDANEIVSRQRVVAFFIKGASEASDSSALAQVRDIHMRRITDLDRMARRIENFKGSLHDAFIMFKVAKMIGALQMTLCKHCGSARMNESDHESLQCIEEVTKMFVEPLSMLSDKLQPFVRKVEETIDVELAEKRGEYQIRSSFSNELTRLAGERSEIDATLAQHHVVVARDLRVEKDKILKLECNRIHGWYFRVSKAQQKVVTSAKRASQYPQIDQIRNDGIKFRDKTLSELNTRSSDCDKMYRQEQYKHEKVFMKTTVLSTVPTLMQASRLLSALDTLCAFAFVSARALIPYVRPEILADTDSEHADITAVHRIELVEARHPCVEAQDSLAAGVDAFVPNDAILASDVGRCVVITGPNMGGKSTYIRSVGVCVVLAQIGCFVPCSSARISICDAILTRVGASDSQLRGVSTFMAEMLETASILDAATQRSLVIVDELGRGTSTSDGFGIAWAVAENLLLQCRSLCMFATHFHELTALAAEHPMLVKNMHVSAAFADGQLTLLYSVLPGPCDRSFGLHVAGLTGFPQQIIRGAKQRAKELHSAFEMKEDEESDGDFAMIGGDKPVISFEARQAAEKEIRSKTLAEAGRLVKMLLSSSAEQIANELIPQLEAAQSSNRLLAALLESFDDSRSLPR